MQLQFWAALPGMTCSHQVSRSNAGILVVLWVTTYEEMLQREHRGWIVALQEESHRLPMDSDEGGRQSRDHS